MVAASKMKKKAGAKPKSAAAKSGAALGRGKSIKQRAAQNIGENLRDLSEEQCFVQTHESGMTMEEMICRDLTACDLGQEIRFGKLYYNGLRSMFAARDSLLLALAPGADDKSIIDPKLEEVILKTV